MSQPHISPHFFVRYPRAALDREHAPSGISCQVTSTGRQQQQQQQAHYDLSLCQDLASLQKEGENVQLLGSRETTTKTLKRVSRPQRLVRWATKFICNSVQRTAMPGGFNRRLFLIKKYINLEETNACNLKEIKIKEQKVILMYIMLICYKWFLKKWSWLFCTEAVKSYYGDCLKH